MLRIGALLSAAVLTFAAQASGLGAPVEISQADTIKLALQYTGLGEEKDVTVSARRENAPEDDNVPFLRLGGKPVWRVRLDNVRLTVRDPSGKTYENPTIHRLDVFLDRANGSLLKIVSPFPADVDPSTRPSLAKREQDMQGSHGRP